MDQSKNVQLKNEKSFQSFTVNSRKYSFSLRYRKNGELYLVISEKKVGKGARKITHKMRIYREAALAFAEKVHPILLDIIETDPDDVQAEGATGNGKGEVNEDKASI
jgi:NAD(P)H-flavin reductase